MRLAQSVDENPQRIRRGAVSSQARDFYTNSCLTCHENKAANKRNHPQDTRGEQSAVTTVDKYNLRPHGVHPCTLHYDTAGTRILCTLRI